MTVKQAIEQLEKLPQDLDVLVASLGDGGNVNVTQFEVVDGVKAQDNSIKCRWVQVEFQSAS